MNENDFGQVVWIGMECASFVSRK